MSPIESTQTTNPIQELAARITKKLDVDGDGSLSSIEFSSFLTQFLGAFQSQALPAGSATTPGATAERTAVGAMAGFDSAKLANASHDTTKYTIGRILQFYPNTPGGLRDALPEIQQIVPGAKIVGGNGDKVDFGGYVDARGNTIGVIDLLVAGGAGGRAWQWAPVD